MRLKFYFFAIAAGLVFCCARPLAADSWTSPARICFGIEDKYVHDNPAISYSCGKMFYSSETRTIYGPDDIYFSFATDSLNFWSQPVYLDSAVNDTVLEDRSPCIGFDDTTFYFVRGNYQDSIWVTYFTGGGWISPQPLDSAINKFASGGPAISKDGNTLYFHSNRPGGYGGNDIWESVKSGGLWQNPVNMGAEINTAFNETEFSLAGNDSDCVFYRSSDTSNIWYYNMGSGDAAKCLFYSHYDSVQFWDNYRYFGPCISWDAQKIYLSCNPEEMEYISWICVSNRLTGVEGKPEDRIPNIEFRMAQNNPNPFSSQTTIKYQTPKSGFVNLKVYNIQGQLVKTLADRVQGAGAYSVTWDGRDEQGQAAGNGVYFCKLNSNGQTQSKKIILMR
jgi:hypothetical protein